MTNDSGFLDNPALLEALTIRARAAYYLAVTESVFAAIPLDEEHRKYAIKAMNLAWQWVAGAAVEGDDIYVYFENADGTALVMYPKGNDEKRGAAWNTVCTAIMYVIWRAYTPEERKYMSQTMDLVDETLVLELHGYAEGTGRFDHQVARRLLNYLQANYPASKPDELGSPVSRAGVIAAGGGASIEA
jgi:hypothetical protein